MFKNLNNDELVDHIKQANQELASRQYQKQEIKNNDKLKDIYNNIIYRGLAQIGYIIN
jgi:hypothetical protein